jgi:hypothetical protein
MRTIMMVVLCTMTACAVDAPDESVATSNQSLICDPDCDPGNFQPLVSAVITAGSGLGTRVSGTMECYHYEGGWYPNPDGGESYSTPHDECAETRQDPWGQQYRVSCNTLASVGCGHYACGYDQSQLPCG